MYDAREGEPKRALRVRPFVSVLCSISLFMAPILAAQQPSASPSDPQTGTRLVEMHVVVKGKGGEPVKDLTSADFTVTDDGHPQKVQLLVQDANEPLPSPAQPLLPNTSPNQTLQQPGTAQNVTVVLLDGLNTNPDDKANVQKLALEFLKQVTPQDRYTICTLGREMHILQDYTGSSSAPTQPQGGDAAADAILADTFQGGANYGMQFRINSTSSVLVAISRHLRALPGRKNLIWVSGSFPFDIQLKNAADTKRMDPIPGTEGANELDQLQLKEHVAMAAEALDIADVAVYPVVDTGGAAPRHGGLVTYGGGPLGAPVETEIQAPESSSSSSPAFTDGLARRTGGKAYHDKKDITVPLREAMADSLLTYDIGFYPENVQWDGSFHRVSVKVNRPGVSVRAREGYYAVLKPALTPEGLQGVVAAAAQSPIDASKMPLTVHVVPTNAAAAYGGTPLGLLVSLDPNSIHFENKDGKYTGSFDLAYVQLDDTGKVIRAKQKVFPLSLSPGQYAQFSKKQVEMSETLWILPAATRFRVILSDPSTGNVGSVTIPIATPNAKQ
jgi:VWFA-related protein